MIIVVVVVSMPAGYDVRVRGLRHLRVSASSDNSSRISAAIQLLRFNTTSRGSEARGWDEDDVYDVAATDYWHTIVHELPEASARRSHSMQHPKLAASRKEQLLPGLKLLA